MPRKGKLTKQRPRRRPRRRVPRPRQLRISPVLPTTKTVRLRYVETISINPAAAAVAWDTFRANGCFDPYVGGVGHQPYGFDTLASMYNSYVVLGSKATFTAISNTTSAFQIVARCMDDDNVGSLSTNPTTVLERYNKQMSTTVGGYYGSNGVASVTSYYSHKDFGIKNALDEDDIGAQVTADPIKQRYHCVGVLPWGIEDQPTMYVRCVIDYLVKFRNPKILPAS